MNKTRTLVSVYICRFKEEYILKILLCLLNTSTRVYNVNDHTNDLIRLQIFCLLFSHWMYLSRLPLGLNSIMQNCSTLYCSRFQFIRKISTYSEKKNNLKWNGIRSNHHTTWAVCLIKMSLFAVVCVLTGVRNPFSALSVQWGHMANNPLLVCAPPPPISTQFKTHTHSYREMGWAKLQGSTGFWYNRVLLGGWP